VAAGRDSNRPALRDTETGQPAEVIGAIAFFEIIDDTHKRACWGPPGRPRPTGFEALPGSRRILQDWEKIGPVPRANQAHLMTNPFETKENVANCIAN
jgi:hypothetical protein